MAIKLRVLHYPDNKKLSALCNDITSSYENSKYDKIPPAYPCENEKLLVCFIKSGKEMTAELKNFVGDLSKARAQNVFFIFGCDAKVGKAIEDLAVNAGTKLAGESKYVKFPALPFLDFSADAKKDIKDALAAVYQTVQG